MNNLLLLFTFFIFSIASQAQLPHIVALENQVYELNNALKYEASQKLLIDFLEKKTSTNEDKYYATLFLSYTYKRLYDYDNVLKYLDIAQSYGLQTTKKDFYLANIQCQKALVYFDIQKYNASDSLMRILSKNNYKHIDAEYQSKIMMQEAYLLYLAKNYTQSEKKYDQAIPLLRGSSPCDLPMIYAKKIDLYDKMNDIQGMNEAYQRSLEYADSCKIIKYTIYTKEVFTNVMIRRNGLNPLMTELDSLRNIYNTNENLKALQDAENRYQAKLKDADLKNKQRLIYLLIAIAVSLLVILIVILYFLWFIRKQRNIISQQNEVNEHLIGILSHDIKEPLLGVRLLLKKLNTNDTLLQKISDSLEQQIASVNSLLNNLLNIKKLQKSANGVESCQVLPVAERTIKALSSQIYTKNISVKNTISADTTLPISSEKLHIILKNVLENAIKFSFNDGEIHLMDISHGIAVRDSGVGISEEKQKKLAHEVVISEQGTSHEQGTGMGLYLIGQLIQNSRISINFKSNLGKGTEVKILKKS